MNRSILTSIIRRLYNNNNKINRYLCTDTNQRYQSKHEHIKHNHISDAEQDNKPLTKINISDRCVERLKKVIDNENQYLRVEVLSGGCSGLQYKFDICDDNQINTDDKVFEKDGVKLVIDDTSLQYMNGSTVDYNEELIRSAFRVVGNPLSEQGCSCGASFTVKLDSSSFKF